MLMFDFLKQLQGRTVVGFEYAKDEDGIPFFRLYLQPASAPLVRSVGVEPETVTLTIKASDERLKWCPLVGLALDIAVPPMPALDPEVVKVMESFPPVQWEADKPTLTTFKNLMPFPKRPAGDATIG